MTCYPRPVRFALHGAQGLVFPARAVFLSGVERGQNALHGTFDDGDTKWCRRCSPHGLAWYGLALLCGGRNDPASPRFRRPANVYIDLSAIKDQQIADARETSPTVAPDQMSAGPVR